MDGYRIRDYVRGLWEIMSPFPTKQDLADKAQQIETTMRDKARKEHNARVREALTSGASSHRIVSRIIERAKAASETEPRARLAAIAQTVQVLGCDLTSGQALVSEMWA